jgi:hypothetical protein
MQADAASDSLSNLEPTAQQHPSCDKNFLVCLGRYYLQSGGGIVKHVIYVAGFYAKSKPANLVHESQPHIRRLLKV